MERKFIFFNTGKGCLVFTIGLGLLFVGALLLAIYSRPSNYVILVLSFLSMAVIVWAAFKMDEKK